jgi:hypothetical protein
MKGGAGWTKNGDTFPGSDMVKDPPGGYYAIKYVMEENIPVPRYKIHYYTFAAIPVGSYFIQRNRQDVMVYTDCVDIKESELNKLLETQKIYDYNYENDRYVLIQQSPRHSSQSRKRTSSSRSPSPAASRKGGRSRKSTKKSCRKSRRNTR